MATHKLFALFSALEKKEVHRLRKFLRSPYHNQREDVLRLYTFLRERYPLTLIPKEIEISAQVYPKETFNEVQVRLVMSYLYRRIKRFLILESLEENHFEQNMILLKIFRDRGLAKGVKETVLAANREVAQSPQREANYYYRKFRVHEGQYQTPVERSDGDFQTNFQQLSGHLDHFYIFSKLKYACGILNHQRLFKVKYDIRLLEEVVRVVEAESLWEKPAIGMYYYVYKLLTAADSEPFFDLLMELVRKEQQVLLPNGVTSIYLFAINYCIRKVNIGDEKFRQVLFDLYLEALEKGLLLKDGELAPWSYKNIVSIGLKVNALNEVEAFLERYRAHLPVDRRESFYQYGLAELFLAKGAFSQVIEGLNPVQFRDPLMALNARITLIKAYYELGDYDLIEYQLDSFKHFLKRKEIVSYHRDNYRAFALHCKAMIQLGPSDHPRRKGLIRRIEEEKKLVGKEWLLQKLGSV